MCQHFVSFSVSIYFLSSPVYYLQQALRQSTDNWCTTAFDIRAGLQRFGDVTYMKPSWSLHQLSKQICTTKEQIQKYFLPLLNVVAIATDISLNFSLIGKIMQPLHFIISRSCFKLLLLIWLVHIFVCRCISKHLGGWRKNNFCMPDVQLCFISLVYHLFR